jgi:hypothetical protein
METLRQKINELFAALQRQEIAARTTILAIEKP